MRTERGTKRGLSAPGFLTSGTVSLPRSLLKVHLQVRGYSVFIDVEKLEAGKFEDKLIQSVQRAPNFILVLSSSALDKCMGDSAMKDWVHKVSSSRKTHPKVLQISPCVCNLDEIILHDIAFLSF